MTGAGVPLSPQKQSPSAVWEQRQTSGPQVPGGPAQYCAPGWAAQFPPEHAKHGAHWPAHAYWANAGVLKLVMIGADHAIAAPPAIRFSIRRREIGSGPTGFFMGAPPPLGRATARRRCPSEAWKIAALIES